MKTLIMLILIFSSSILQASPCKDLLNPLDIDRIKKWVQVYEDHQRQLRLEAGLEFKEPDIKKAFKIISKKLHKRITPEKPLILGGSLRPIYEITDHYLIPRPKTDDANFLNYVYEFDGEKLVRAIPALEYFISQIEEDIVYLARSMNSEEYTLWKNFDLQGLRNSVPRTNWGYNIPKFHFALGLYSYFPRSHSIMFAVPKEILLKWGRKNQASLGMERWESEGKKSVKPKLIEIVILDGALEELITYITP